MTAPFICALLLLLVESIGSLGITKEMAYTQNSLCRQNSCTNPIFPGLNDLPRLEALQWQCSTTSSTHQYMDFCKDAVVYDPALPSPGKKTTAVSEVVKAQEDAAMTMFVYHLGGMGYEAWDYRQPSQSENDCVRSIWKMVCFTYFPRADAGCQAGQQSFYKRPCKSSCQNYLHHCGVECCDESVQCVFAHTATNSTGQVQLLQTGYVDQSGPSAMCTGSAKRSRSSPLVILLGILGLHYATSFSFTHTQTEPKRHLGRLSKYLLAGLLGLLSFSLQGCQIPTHAIGNWRTKQNYLSEFKVVPPGTSSNNALLNSCNEDKIPTAMKCSGRGHCEGFSMNVVATQQSNSAPMSFCQCQHEWADPECGTKRKSQLKTFFLSVFLGLFGADYFYLGYPLWGLGKLCTLGGCGFWWLIDIVRTGAGPVYAQNFRTANDLPHWVAVLIMVFLSMLIGFSAAIQNFLVVKRQRRLQMASLQNKEEARHWNKNEEEMMGFDGPRFRNKGANNFQGRPRFVGYGATLPLPHPNASTPYAGYGHDPTGCVGPFGPAGIPGEGSPTPVGRGFAPTHSGLCREGATPLADANLGMVL